MTIVARTHRLGRIAALASLVIASHGSAMAQAPDRLAVPAGANVAWAAGAPVTVGKNGRAALVLHGAVRDGWHVYGPKQRDSGPTPLRVTLDPTDLAKPDGQPIGSPPTTAFEPAFGFATPYYARDFTLTVPVRLDPRAKGRQSIPVSVRFQTCNGRICEPPKTVRLSVPVAIGADA